jgi:hypothetical protein
MNNILLAYMFQRKSQVVKIAVLLLSLSSCSLRVELYIYICIYILQICSLLRGGIAERGGVRVGHRIIEINNQSVVAVQHEKIVSLLANSVGEVSEYISRVLYLLNFILDLPLN